MLNKHVIIEMCDCWYPRLTNAAALVGGEPLTASRISISEELWKRWSAYIILTINGHRYSSYINTPIQVSTAFKRTRQYWPLAFLLSCGSVSTQSETVPECDIL